MSCWGATGRTSTSAAFFSLVLAHVVLIGVLALKQGIGPAIFCVPLPFLTLIFNHTFVQLPYSNPSKAMPLLCEPDAHSQQPCVLGRAGPRELTDGAHCLVHS